MKNILWNIVQPCFFMCEVVVSLFSLNKRKPLDVYLDIYLHLCILRIGCNKDFYRFKGGITKYFGVWENR